MIIAGCGFLGSSLLHQLCWHRLAKEIHIYDYDELTQADVDLFPLYDERNVGQFKVIALKSLLTKRFPGVEVVAHVGKFDTTTKDIGREVFDCRDIKQDDFSYTSRFSFDCNLLMMDSRTIGSCVQQYESHNYIQPKNPIMISIASNIICEYIKRKAYEAKTCAVVDFNRFMPFIRRP